MVQANYNILVLLNLFLILRGALGLPDHSMVFSDYTWDK